MSTFAFANALEETRSLPDWIALRNQQMEKIRVEGHLTTIDGPIDNELLRLAIIESPHRYLAVEGKQKVHYIDVDEKQFDLLRIYALEDMEWHIVASGGKIVRIWCARVMATTTDDDN